MPPDVLDLNLDALRTAAAEAQKRGFRFRLNNHDFETAPEMPIDVIEPLLPRIPKLIDLLSPIFKGLQTPEAGQPVADDLDIASITDALLKDPMLPGDVIDGFLIAGRRLFGDEQWDLLKAARLTIPEASTLLTHIWRFYGLSLGGPSRSADSSAPGGQTSKSTSNGSKGSTPVKRSSRPGTRKR